MKQKKNWISLVKLKELYPSLKPLRDFPGYLITIEGLLFSQHNRLGLRTWIEESRAYARKWQKDHSEHIRIMLKDSNGKMKNVYRGRIIYESYIGVIPVGMQIDHIDRNASNDSFSNLRIATIEQNSSNRLTKIGRSGYKNIITRKVKRKKGYTISYLVNVCEGEKRNYRTFSSLAEALEYRDKLLLKLRGDFALLHY